MRANGLLSGQMVDERARNAEAAVGRGSADCACAAGHERGEVGAVGAVAEVDGSAGVEGVAEALGGVLRLD